ncbi:MAG: methyltransferase domain-containing protein [Chthoniobacterales bacterium]|nr:methyltransferase domain-containing protein [Chthoniobacterales bacterium]
MATLDCPEPIVEIGAFRVAGQEAISDLRPLFPGKRYIGCDMQSGPGVDRIENIHELSFQNGEVGTFLLSDTLEHVADPIRAMNEVHRCLRPGGVAVYTSVMNFPIHGYPNDYWRFTPEAFRELAARFERVMIFFCGPKDFPHTVCGVAGKGDYSPDVLRTLAERAADIRTTAPLIVEARAGRVIQNLMSKLMRDTKSTSPAQDGRAGFDRLAKAGWYLVTGQWLTGWTTVAGVSEVEILAGETVLHRARLTRARPDLAKRLQLTDPEAKIGFSEQIDLSALGDYAGTFRMALAHANDEREIICESAPGLALGSIPLETEFAMHSFDERPAIDALAAGRELIEAIRARGETVQVDLGCGLRKNGNLGIDVTTGGTSADLMCRLGFEPIPLDDGSADTIFCRDFLEHLPKAYYSEREQTLRYPIIDLMNEIWRILKSGGAFTSFTPCYPAVEVHRDPTHLSVWTLESMPYFCGKYPVAKTYGVKCNFTLEENRLDDFYLHSVLRKPAAA